jgi:hypothetical protein
MLMALSVGIHLVPGLESKFEISNVFFAFIFGAGLFLSLLPWVGMLFLSQGAEVQPITIAALRSNVADKTLYVYSGCIVAVSLLGFFLVFQSLLPPIWSFAGAVVCIGLLLDLLRMSYCRLQFRRTPEGLVEWFIEVMMESVRKGDEKWYTISFEIPFAMMVVYMKNGAYGSLRLFCHGIDKISNLWLGSIARLRLYEIPMESEVSLLDRYLHAEHMTVKRVSWILEEACTIGSIAAVEEATRLAGKLFVVFHSYHESLGSVLLTTLSQASQKDTGRIGSKDLDTEVVSTLCEVIKALIDRNKSDLAPVFKVLVILESKLKEMYRHEKNINSILLMHPLVELTHLLENVRYRSFLGHEEILA